MELRSVRRPALCPACGAPGVYVYEIRGPVEKDRDRFVEFSYSFRCEICGHEESGKMLIQLDAIYRLRHLLVPEAMAAVEKVKVLSDVVSLSAGVRAETEATEAQGQA